MLLWTAAAAAWVWAMNHDRSNGQVRGQWIADAAMSSILMCVVTPLVYFLVRKWPNALAVALLLAVLAVGTAMTEICRQLNAFD